MPPELREARVRELLSEFAQSMEAVAWNAWSKKLRPDSPVRREGVLRESLARAMAGEMGPLERDLAALRRLSGALIAAVAQAAERYALLHVNKFGVESIEATAEKPLLGSLAGGKDGAAWRKYRSLMGEADAGKARDLIESELMRCVAEFAEQLAMGLRENEAAAASEPADETLVSPSQFGSQSGQPGTLPGTQLGSQVGSQFGSQFGSPGGPPGGPAGGGSSGFIPRT